MLLRMMPLVLREQMLGDLLAPRRDPKLKDMPHLPFGQSQGHEPLLNSQVGAVGELLLLPRLQSSLFCIQENLAVCSLHARDALVAAAITSLQVTAAAQRARCSQCRQLKFRW